MSEADCREMLVGVGSAGSYLCPTADRWWFPSASVRHAGDVVFRAFANSSIIRSLGSGEATNGDLGHEPVGFEVDHFDDALSEGWSVIATGQIHEVVDGERAKAEALRIEPWTASDRDCYVRMRISDVSGWHVRTLVSCE